MRVQKVASNWFKIEYVVVWGISLDPSCAYYDDVDDDDDDDNDDNDDDKDDRDNGNDKTKRI